MKITLSLARRNATAIAELHDNKAPTAVNSFLDVLPIKSSVFHARWGGNEIWTSLTGFSKYANENETCLPAPGDICIVPTGENSYDLAIWYGTGWIFGPEFGFKPATVIGRIVSNLSDFAVAANEVLLKGEDVITITKCIDDK